MHLDSKTNRKSKQKISARWLERARNTEHLLMILAATIIGVIAGLGAIGIRAAITAIGELSFGYEGGLLANIQATPWYFLLLIPTLGGLIVGPVIYFLAPEAKGTGVPEVMQSVLVHGGVIRPRVALVKAFASSVTIGTGGSVGREGPIVQIGSSLGSMIAQFFSLNGTRTKTLVGCGAAAGIAAAFNAPVAGALFAVEIILMDFAVAQFSPIVISSVVATVISHKFEGNFAAFTVPHYEIVSYWEILFYVVLGLLCGVVSYLFIKTIYGLDHLILKKVTLSPMFLPAVGGFIIGGVAIFYPQIMGVGYDSINLALHGQMFGRLALALVLLKMVSTAVTLGFGGSGGVFAPSLFVGAMLGSAYGGLVDTFWPDLAADSGAYALVAMGGIVAGTTRAPITAILTIFELTNQYDIILPLMVTCIGSTLLSGKLSRESIYSMKLVQRQLTLRQGRELNPMRSIFIRNVFNPNVATISQTAHFKEIVERMLAIKSPYLCVIDQEEHLVGIISMSSIKPYLFEKDFLTDLIIAKDIANQDVRFIPIMENCQTALELMEDKDLLGLPVVDPMKSLKLVGMIWQKDILNAYQQEVLHQDFGSTLVNQIHSSQAGSAVAFAGLKVMEIPTPKSFIGYSLIELDIRAKYRVMVVAVRRFEESGVKLIAFPEPQFIIEYEEDHLILAGEAIDVDQIRNLS